MLLKFNPTTPLKLQVAAVNGHPIQAVGIDDPHVGNTGRGCSVYSKARVANISNLFAKKNVENQLIGVGWAGGWIEPREGGDGRSSGVDGNALVGAQGTGCARRGQVRVASFCAASWIVPPFKDNELVPV